MIGFIHVLDGDADGAFRWAISVAQSKPRRVDRNEFLTTSDEVTKARAVIIFRELAGDLRRHEAVGNLVFFKVIRAALEVETHFLVDNVESRTGGKGVIDIKHRRVETKGGISEITAPRLELKTLSTELHEGRDVAADELYAFGFSRGSRGIKHDEEIVALIFGARQIELGQRRDLVGE